MSRRKNYHLLLLLICFVTFPTFFNILAIKANSDIYQDYQFHNSRSGNDHLWRSNPSSAEIFSRSLFNSLDNNNNNNNHNKGGLKINSQNGRDSGNQKPIKNSSQVERNDKNKKPSIPDMFLQNSVEIQCPPCEKVHCSPRRPRHLRCRGGLVRGVCGCCPVCAKQLDETCGGHWNYLGTCDKGLICEAAELSHDLPIEAGSDKNALSTPGKSRRKNRNESSSVYESQRRFGERYSSRSTQKSHLNVTRKEMNGWSQEGRCVPGYELNDSPTSVVKCRPKCSLEFCLENPKEICSAIDNAEEKKPCSGPCQHTSCSACRLIKRVPECPGCPTEDFECFRKFGRCLKQEMCLRNHFPCRNLAVYHIYFLSNKEQSNYMFRCFTPSCLP